MTAPLKLFISYSHHDEAYRERLAVHLAALELEGYYQVWHDRKLLAGQDWAQKIDEHLAESDVVLLLVSADFINSRYVWSLELEQAIRQEAAGKTRIVSVILKPCRWHRGFSPLARRQALPPRLDQIKSVSEHPGGEDKAFDEVMEGLEQLCEEMRAARAGSQSAQTAGQVGLADRVHFAVGRRPRRILAAAGVILIAGSLLAGHAFLRREADFGWRLLQVGDYPAARTHLSRARWWPGLDRHGADFARLGALLPQLGDEAVRRDFITGLEALDKAAPAAGFTAYLRGIAEFDAGLRRGDPERWLHGAASQFEEAVRRDPALAEAHAGLALLLTADCQLDRALQAIAAADRAGGALAPGRYAVQKADILARFADPERRQEALALYASQDAEASARFAQAMLAWDGGDWVQARAALARATDQLVQEEGRAGWMFFLPGGPWFLGVAAAKRCLLTYASAVGERLATGERDVRAAWNEVTRACAGIEPDARELICAHLPEDAALPARRDLACPSPQPRAQCPVPPEPPMLTGRRLGA